MPTDADDILLGTGAGPVYLRAKYGNRHGLTAGATGTGKTVSLLLIAEGFSRIGVPVVIADVKGDVAGLGAPGVLDDRIRQRDANLRGDLVGTHASPSSLPTAANAAIARSTSASE